MAWTENKAIVINSLEELKKIKLKDKVALLAQTTEKETNFNELVAYLQTQPLDLKILPTICSATRIRQKAAVKLAKQVDLMIVIGGRHSSNTKKLKEVCQKYVTTYQVEQADELQPKWFQNKFKIGVTAGASTPDWIIKEVIEQMEEYKMDVQEENMEESSKQNNVATEEAVLPQTEETTPNSIDLGEQINIQTFRPGDLITGTIVR